MILLVYLVVDPQPVIIVVEIAFRQCAQGRLQPLRMLLIQSGRSVPAGRCGDAAVGFGPPGRSWVRLWTASLQKPVLLRAIATYDAVRAVGVQLFRQLLPFPAAHLVATPAVQHLHSALQADLQNALNYPPTLLCMSEALLLLRLLWRPTCATKTPQRLALVAGTACA